MKKAIVFDFDGTLANSIPIIYKVTNKLAKDFHFKTFNEKEFERLRDKSSLEILMTLHIPIFRIPKIVKEGQDAMRVYLKDIPLYEGITDMLKELKNEYTLGIVTSNSKSNVELFLKKHQLRDYFSFVYGGWSIFGKQRKLRKMMNAHVLTAEEILYVGDEIRDIKACKKAGIDILSVTWGWNTENILKKENPEYLIHTVGEIVPLIRGLK